MMQPAGIVKQMSLSGGLIIPSDLRDALGWQGGSSIAMYLYDGFLVLRSAPEKDALLQELNKLLRGLDEESLRALLDFARRQKWKQGRTD